MICPLSSCSTGKALGHRQGISATAAEIAGKEKKKKCTDSDWIFKVGRKGEFSGVGIKFCCACSLEDPPGVGV